MVKHWLCTPKQLHTEFILPMEFIISRPKPSIGKKTIKSRYRANSYINPLFVVFAYVNSVMKDQAAQVSQKQGFLFLFITEPQFICFYPLHTQLYLRDW